MDELGERIVRDRSAITDMLNEANRLEQKAHELSREAAEMESLLQLRRLQGA